MNTQPPAFAFDKSWVEKLGKMKTCLACGKKLVGRQQKYCSSTCQNEHRYMVYIERWKAGKETGLKGEYQLSNYVRKYIFRKYDNKCSNCGWGEINPYSQTLPLEVEHIDGNHLNNKEDNLTLLCPNCHSLTATYKGANKGNGRTLRKKYSC